MKRSQMGKDILSHWTVKLHENVAQKRNLMFTYISRAQQLLTLGNAGGIGFVLGVFPAGQDTGLLHWLVLGAIVSYMLGVLCTVLGMALVCTIVIKEAHIAETAMT